MIKVARPAQRSSILAVIPARGGSKGIPRKNLRRVGGLSLVGRAIRAAADSGEIDQVIVSTEDAEVRAETLRCGAIVRDRPMELADDRASVIDVIVDALTDFEGSSGNVVTAIVVVEPTSPFRTADHVRRTVLKHLEQRSRSTVTVCPLERKPENIFRKGETLLPYVEQPLERFARRQDMAHLCRVNSAVYVVDRDAFLAERSLLMQPIGYVEMTTLESLNIDEELDLEWAAFLAERYAL